MRVFALMRLSDPTKSEASIKEHFPDDRSLRISSTEWLVAGKGTAKEISDQIGLSDGVSGSGIVFRTEGYFGRAPSDIWDWMKARLEESDGQ